MVGEDGAVVEEVVVMLLHGLSAQLVDTSDLDNSRLPVVFALFRSVRVLLVAMSLVSPHSPCMGISEASIAAIVREGDGGGYRYVCTKCRMESHPGGGGQDNNALDEAAFS